MYQKEVVIQNQYQFNNFKKRFPDKKITIIHNPYKIPTDMNVIKNIERGYIAWIGLFQYQKNMMSLFDIAKELPNQKFKIAGQAINNVDYKTKEAIEKLKLLNNVEFTGYISIENIPGFLFNAKILLNTSFYEGFSNTFLEAFSVGTPVVCSKDVDPDNIIKENNLGRVSDSYSDLPETVTKFLLLDDIDRIRDNCTKYVTSKHNPKILSETLLEYLNS